MSQSMSDDQNSRSRPKLFRALGEHEPPREITLEGVTYQRSEIIKHDSWAATAIYQSDSAKVVCKFNRVQSIFGFPMQWLGRWLARREREMYFRLNHLENIPNGFQSVYAEGELLRNAAAHEFIEGSPLSWHHRLDKKFFQELEATVNELHRQRIAVVDLNKKENIIVGNDQRPYLIDFQISVRIPRFPILSSVLKILQKADRYHLAKHFSYLRPDMLPGFQTANYDINRPLWISLHRKIAIPFRQLRRRLLVSLQVRKGDGKVHSEQFVESGLRQVATHHDPLLALFELITSPAYFNASGNENETYIENLFTDLFDRPTDQHDQGLVDVLLDGRSRQEIAMQLLRAPSLFAISECLSDDWLRQRQESIQARLFGDSDMIRSHLNFAA